MTKVSNGEKKTKGNDKEILMSIMGKELQYQKKVRNNMLKPRNLTYHFKRSLNWQQTQRKERRKMLIYKLTQKEKIQHSGNKTVT